jgi:hypothetical protein
MEDVEADMTLISNADLTLISIFSYNFVKILNEK